LQPRDPSRRVHFCSWFVLPVAEGEIDPQLTFFSDKATGAHRTHIWPTKSRSIQWKLVSGVM
jgi:hypothetical protein